MSHLCLFTEDELNMQMVANDNELTEEEESAGLGKPFMGQTFVDLEEAYLFYKNYAKTIGFDVRKSSQKAYLNKDVGFREVALKVYVCNKEGSWNERSEENDVKRNLAFSHHSDHQLSPTSNRRSGTFRCGCKASLTVRIDFQSKIWTVVNFREEHNHALTSPSKKHYMKLNREISVSMSNYIEILESIGFSTSQISRVITSQSGGYNKCDALMLDIKNFRRDKREDIKNYDAEMVLEYFQRLKCKDPAFYYAYKTDDDKRLTHLFWADATCQQDYELFGEAITFDTTFKTNQYHMIFAGFCGINHHRQTVFFGSGFLINETKESFVWLFEEYLNCMGNKSPKVIITDQDRGMKAAISICLPTAVHRLCSWHILSKLPVKIGALVNKKDVMREFGNIVWSSNSIEAFETGWKEWVSANGMESNDWLCSIYELRSQWVPIYLLRIFSAGMKTTQRSEGMNAFLRSRVTQFNTLFEFIVRYEDVMKSLREKENHSDHMDQYVLVRYFNLLFFSCYYVCYNYFRNTTPVLSTSLIIEKEASILYTATIFKIFQDNLKNALTHGVSQNIEVNIIYLPFSVI